MGETTQIKIEVPQGMVIDTESSNLAEGIIKFKPIEKQLPKTWEEFCKTHPIKNYECYIGAGSGIYEYINNNRERNSKKDKNTGTKETCEAILALMQLIQLRDCYNDGWKPNWDDKDSIRFIIFSVSDDLYTGQTNSSEKNILAFKTKELCVKFLNNFRDLIEITKPLNII